MKDVHKVCDVEHRYVQAEIGDVNIFFFFKDWQIFLRIHMHQRHNRLYIYIYIYIYMVIR
jgi:hypothetical protein